MGTEDTAKKGFFSSKATFKNRSTIFSLGNRDTVLTTELEDPIIVIPHAQRAERKVCVCMCACVRVRACVCLGNEG